MALTPLGANVRYLVTISRTDLSHRKRRWEDPSHRSKIRKFGPREMPLAYRALLALIDEDGEIVKAVPLWSPKGILRVQDRLLVACFSEIRSFSLDLSSSETFVDARWCNDLHSLRPTPNGVVVAVSGVDAFVELSTDGEVVYEWWAAEHGFDVDV